MLDLLRGCEARRVSERVGTARLGFVGAKMSRECGDMACAAIAGALAKFQTTNVLKLFFAW
jgi:hypothetical protein